MAEYSCHWYIDGTYYDWPMTVEIDEDKAGILSITVPVEKEDGKTVNLRFVPDDENAKLRELVRIMYYCNLPQKDCDKCAMNGADMEVQVSDIDFCDGLNERMRELGIEV